MTCTRGSAGVVTAVLAAAALAGCGGSELECGAFTVARDGKCVPVIDGCAEGTELQNGTCVPACDKNERWDGASCVSLRACAAGTKDVGGQCVPECATTAEWDGKKCVPLIACVQGTVLDPQTGACVAAAGVCAAGAQWENGACVPEVLCGPGTYAKGGKCLPQALPVPDVTESTDSDGAADFAVPASGGSIVLGGVVDEPQGFGAPDWDRFRFVAEAGTWLRIEASSAGALRPAFVVRSAELGADGMPRYERYELEPNEPRGSREVYLPFAGTYEIRVTDYAHVLSSVFSSVQSIPVGGPDFGYSVEVKNLGVPTPEKVSLPSTKTGDLSGGKLHFFSATGLAAGSFAGVSSMGVPPPEKESDAFRAVMVFGPTGAFLGQNVAYQTYAAAEMPFSAVAGGDYLVVQDYLMKIGSRDDFSLELFAMQPLTCAGDACKQGSIPADGNQLLRWDLKKGDFLTAGVYMFSADAYVKVSIYDGDMQPALADSAANPGAVGMAHYFAEKQTSAYVWLREWDGIAIPEYQVEATVIATPEFKAGNTYTNQPVSEMPPYTLRNAGIGHYQAKAGQMVFFTGLATHPDGWAAPQELLMTTRLDTMGPVIDTQAWNFPDGFVTPLFTYVNRDGYYLHYVWDGGDPIANATYDVRMTAYDTFDLGAPDVGKPVQVSGHNLSKGMALYRFAGKANQYSEITVSPKLLASMVPDLWVFNLGRAEFEWVSYKWVGDMGSPRLGLIERKTGTSSDPVTIGYTSPYDGTTVLLVQTSNGSGSVLDSYDMSVTVPAAPGNDTCAKAGPIKLDASGHASFSWDSSPATNDLDHSGCSDYATPGPDVFFSVTLKAGDTLDVKMTSTEFSAALYVFPDCQDIKGTCVGASESGSPRHVVFTVPPGKDGTYVIAADSHNYGGSFDMDVQVTGN